MTVDGDADGSSRSTNDDVLARQAGRAARQAGPSAHDLTALAAPVYSGAAELPPRAVLTSFSARPSAATDAFTEPFTAAAVFGKSVLKDSCGGSHGFAANFVFYQVGEILARKSRRATAGTPG